MELFDVVKMVFEKPVEWKKLKKYEKIKFFFMLQRFYAINYPLQVQAFNHVRISQEETLDWWQSNLGNIYSKVPKWIYTKTKKREKEKETKYPGEEAITMFLSKKGWTRRDLDQAVTFFGADALQPIFDLEKQLK